MLLATKRPWCQGAGYERRACVWLAVMPPVALSAQAVACLLGIQCLYNPCPVSAGDVGSGRAGDGKFKSELLCLHHTIRRQTCGLIAALPEAPSRNVLSYICYAHKGI